MGPTNNITIHALIHLTSTEHPLGSKHCIRDTKTSPCTAKGRPQPLTQFRFLLPYSRQVGFICSTCNVPEPSVHQAKLVPKHSNKVDKASVYTFTVAGNRRWLSPGIAHPPRRCTTTNCPNRKSGYSKEERNLDAGWCVSSTSASLSFLTHPSKCVCALGEKRGTIPFMQFSSDSGLGRGTWSPGVFHTRGQIGFHFVLHNVLTWDIAVKMLPKTLDTRWGTPFWLWLSVYCHHHILKEISRGNGQGDTQDKGAIRCPGHGVLGELPSILWMNTTGCAGPTQQWAWPPLIGATRLPQILNLNVGSPDSTTALCSTSSLTN